MELTKLVNENVKYAL